MIENLKWRATALALAAAVAAPFMGRANVRVPGDWAFYSSSPGSTKYSPLDQINRQNVHQLRIAWRQSAITPEVRRARQDMSAPTNWEHTPLMVAGVLYMLAGDGLSITALDPETGRLLWVDTPPERKEAGTQYRANRGVTYWTDGDDARIITVAGQYLVAVNAKTGKRYSNFGKNGEVDLTKDLDRTRGFGFRWGSPPVVVRDVIIVGGLATDGVDVTNESSLASDSTPPGDIRGYDVRTGRLLWKFHTVPRTGEFGNDTWLKDSWAYSGNTSVWGLMSADDELGYVYLPIETPTGDYYGGTRPGNNLFAESLVCLDAKTGKRVWHFQAVHHGLWDYDFAAPPVLVDIRVDGRTIKAVAQVSKQAFVYVLDRVTGTPVWPIEERPVPSGNVTGEWYSPTQPFPTKPPPYDQQGVAESDLVDFTPELRAEAFKIINQYRYGPLFTPPSTPNGPDGKKGTILLPGTVTNVWNGAAADPETGILYVPSVRGGVVIELVKSKHPRSTIPLVRKALETWIPGPQGLPDPFKPPYGRVTAIDLNKGEILWVVPNGEGPRQHPTLKHLNLPWLGQRGRAAPLLTKTLLFLGEGTSLGVHVPPGGGGKTFRAYDKATGEVVWEMELPGATTGAPMTYMVNGTQYIVVAVGWSDLPGELVALALP